MNEPNSNDLRQAATSTQGSPRPPASGRGSRWGVGVAIAAIGMLLLARNLGVDLSFLHFHNWWATFILLMAVPPLMQGIRQFAREGFSFSVLNSLLSAGAIIFLALIFLLNLSIWTWWPVFLIFGGMMLVTGRN